MDLIALLLLAISLAPFSFADDTTHNATSGAVFVYAPGSTDFNNKTTYSQQLIFALNIDNVTNDLHFHMSCPAGVSWFGVGFGSQMENSLMLITYASGNEKSVTISPRVGDAQREPSYTDQIKCELASGDGLVNSVSKSGEHDTPGAMTVNGVCHNATSWSVGKLDVGSTKQPFIFAIGPPLPMSSDSMTASLRQHDFHGAFTMDMTKVTTANATSPKPNGLNETWVSLNSGSPTSLVTKHNPAPIIHGFVMCFAYVIVFPLGSLISRIVKRVIMHAIVQCIGLLLTVMSTVGGFIISMKYNKSRQFRSAHQVIGILLLLALLGQLGLGLMNHRIAKKEKRTTIMGKIHKYLGPGVILVGIINAGLGFNLAGDNFLGRPFAAIVIVFALGYVAIIGLNNLRLRRKKRAQIPEGYQQPQFAPAPGGPPPPYGYYGGPPQDSYGHAQHDVPMQAYARPAYEREPSSYSNGTGYAVQARPMI